MKKRKFKILFRIAGGRTTKKELGLGHIYRSLNLSEQLKKNELFFLIEDYGGVKNIIKNYDYSNIFFIKKNITIEQDIKKTHDFIQKNNIDLLIVDKFRTESKFISEMKKKLKTVIITDLDENNYDADLIINGFIGFENQINFNKYGSKCLFGPTFQILNKKFLKIKSNKNKKYRLLATFGGFDAKNISEIFLEQLIKNQVKFKTKLILGPSTKKRFDGKIRQLGSRLELVEKTDNMKQEIANSMYGICSGGLTSYEFAISKCPFGIISQQKHQLLTAKQWADKGFAQDLGMVDSKSRKKIAEFLHKVEKKQLNSIGKRKFLDGMGSQRVAKEILKLLKK